MKIRENNPAILTFIGISIAVIIAKTKLKVDIFFIVKNRPFWNWFNCWNFVAYYKAHKKARLRRFLAESCDIFTPEISIYEFSEAINIPISFLIYPPWLKAIFHVGRLF